MSLRPVQPAPAAVERAHRPLAHEQDGDLGAAEPEARQRELDEGLHAHRVAALPVELTVDPFTLPDERLGAGAHGLPLPTGRLVLADAQRPIAELFGDVADDVRPGRRTQRLRLIAVRIPGVPAIHVEEAVWACQEALGTSPVE